MRKEGCDEVVLFALALGKCALAGGLEDGVLWVGSLYGVSETSELHADRIAVHHLMGEMSPSLFGFIMAILLLQLCQCWPVSPHMLFK